MPNAATIQLVDVVDKSTESSKPGSRNKEVEWVVHELARKWEQPDHREDDADAGDDFDVDFAAFGANTVLVILVEEVGVQAQHNRGAHELAEAEEGGHES